MLSDANRILAKLTPKQVIGLAVTGVAVVGVLDYLSGYEYAFSIFYLAPVGLAAWYAERRAGIAVAVLASIVWLAADLAAGNPYSSPIIPAWNTTARFAFFLSNALLLASLRMHLTAEQQLARIDPLTGAMNSRAFAEHLEYCLALARREGSALSLAYVDLDDFKHINDNFGHSEGDRVLHEIAQVMRATVRQTDVVARLGGDEFALLMPATDVDGAARLISKVRERMDSSASGGRATVTCSISAVCFRAPLPTADRAIMATDNLMYRVKRGGKNAVGYGVFDPASDGDVQLSAPGDAPEAARP